MEKGFESCDRRLHTIFLLCCWVATVSVTSYCAYRYSLNEDVARVEFAEFNANENNIYPTITLCFPRPLLESRLKEYGNELTAEKYFDFLKGRNNSWDEKMTKQS